MNKFSQTTIDNLGYYVYKLVDPRNNKPFYIGKGTKNRVFEHEIDALSNITGTNENKLDLIRNIIEDGYEVRRVIVKHNLTEDEAFKLECALIDTYNDDGFKLTNIQGGHHSNIDTVENLEIFYSPEDIDLTSDVQRIIRINVNKAWDKNLSYRVNMERVKGNWRMSEDKIKNAISNNAIVLFEKNGICVGTAKLVDFMNSTPEQPDSFGVVSVGRKILIYDVTRDERYINKRLLPLRNPEDGSGIIQQPILYYNIN